MDAFQRLSPALQYHIVNELGWPTLRPVQQHAIPAVLDGRNCVVLAPTAGGKTEAALFPLLSAMDQEDWRATSLLYVAPIRALLNNQEARLIRLAGMLGRRAMKWHGDVGASARKRFIREPTDILAITPESVEAMLMSTRTPGAALLRHVRAVVVDEVHAFASDDRGAHLAALLERITRISDHDVQRIGLSATVGDPDAICVWLSGSSTRQHEVVSPGGAASAPSLRLDHVGNLENAALMIDRLHPGTRRLVFVDSRRRVEALGDHLQRRGVNVTLSHSSLAASERHAAERAFEEGDNCVIVATSALELGIDVGDLDHVLQIDAPATVSSFLQRMGRTGRRPGTASNCTFLATSSDAVLQAAGLLRLRARGYVEPTEPTRWAPHILAHQLLALALQQHGVAKADWWSWLNGCASFAALDGPTRDAICDHMLAAGILVEADGRLILGEHGERRYGAKHFMELFAVFSVPQVLKILHGKREVGTIDAWFAQPRDDGPLCFKLANRSWQIEHIDWRAATAQVKPADEGAYPRWMGRPKLLSHALCQAMREVLVDGLDDPIWSQRARTAINKLREQHRFLRDDDVPLVRDDHRATWWTFAGGKTNDLIAALLQQRLGAKVSASNLKISLSPEAAKSDVAFRQALQALAKPGAIAQRSAAALLPKQALNRLSKFQPCLPPEIERELAVRSLLDVDGAVRVIQRSLA
jgi:ATP-dependent helicase Lhr and Lhr-like helicase